MLGRSFAWTVEDNPARIDTLRVWRYRQRSGHAVVEARPVGMIGTDLRAKRGVGRNDLGRELDEGDVPRIGDTRLTRPVLEDALADRDRESALSNGIDHLLVILDKFLIADH